MNLSQLNRTLTMMGRLLDRRRSTVPLVAPRGKKPLYSAENHTPLPRATPESQGVSSRTLAAFFDALKRDDTLNMHTVTVMRNGYVLATAEFGDADAAVWRTTFSASKSVIALAIGLLVDDGRLQLDDRVIDLFDGQISPLARRKFKELTVEDLLTMQSGVTFNEVEAACEEDWVKAFFSAAVRGEIGGDFQYNSMNTYLLAAIVRRLTGESVCDFLRPRLFDPLGIGTVYWETCPRGIEKGGWGLFIHPEDLARLGQLVLQRGVWQGKRLISEEWIAAATAPHATAPDDYGDYDYGYHIWSGRTQHRFLFNGLFGQNVMGFWDNGILIVSHAGNNEMFQQSSFFPLAHRTFGGAFPDALPPNEEAEKTLSDALSGLRTAYPVPPQATVWQRMLHHEPPPLPALCYRLNGVSLSVQDEQEAASVGLFPVALQLTSNRYADGLRRLRFAVEGDTFVVYYEEVGDVFRLPVGFYAAERVALRFGEDVYEVAVSGRCAADEEGRDVLLLRLSFLETPCTRRLKLVCGTSTWRLTQEEQPGEEFVDRMLRSLLSGLEKQPLVGGAVQKIDPDYLYYKTERLFSPRLVLKKDVPMIE